VHNAHSSTLITTRPTQHLYCSISFKARVPFLEILSVKRCLRRLSYREGSGHFDSSTHVTPAYKFASFLRHSTSYICTLMTPSFAGSTHFLNTHALRIIRPLQLSYKERRQMSIFRGLFNARVKTTIFEWSLEDTLSVNNGYRNFD
jgi:hypothetical protein